MNDRTIAHEADVRAVIRDEVVVTPVFEGSEEIVALFTEGVNIPNVITAESYINGLGSQYNVVLARLAEVGILTIDD